MEPVSSSPPSTQTERSFEQPQPQQLAPLGALIFMNAVVRRMIELVSSSPPMTQTERSIEQPQPQQLAPLGIMNAEIIETIELVASGPPRTQTEIPFEQPQQQLPPLDSQDNIWCITEVLGLSIPESNEAPSSMMNPSQKILSIYRVPDRLKDPSRTMVYTPRVVSIGPYHHGTAPLQKMERHKWLFHQHVLERTGQDTELYRDSMKELEPSVRACYAEESELTSDQFVEMMLLDGCFMLEILQWNGLTKLRYAKDDPIFSIMGARSDIQRDMTMLENQIPLFVLDKLFGLQSKDPSGERSVLEIVDKFFDNLMPSKVMATKGLHCLDVIREKFLKGEPTIVEGGAHQKMNYGVTDLRNAAISMLRNGIHVVRKKLLNELPKVGREDENRERLNYCVTELRNAGIKFRKGDRGKSLLDIEFKNGILYIPQILIDDGFKLLFSNLIAYEQCHFDSGQQHIASYVAFLDALIDSSEDVRCLKSHEIITHIIGSDAEVADIINSLCRDVVYVITDSYLSHLSYRINKYRNQTWNIWRATLKERYFNNPWAIISFVAAAILLILTATQTLYAVYSYYRPNN